MNASSREARAAMRAAIDKEIWRQAKATAQQVDLSLSYWQINGIIDNASTRNAKVALRASVDSEVWRQAKAGKVDLEISSRQASNTLDNISNRKLRHIMKLMVMRTPRSERHTTSSHDSSTRQQAPPFSYKPPNFDDMFRDMFGNRFGGAFGQDAPPRGGHQRTRGRTTPPPRQERPRTQESRKYQEVDDVLKAAARKYFKQNPDAPKWEGNWLARVDKESIQRIINSVKTIRKQADEKGETVTDRQIYIMYRRKIETNDVDEATKERLTASTQIMLALMDGKPNGKLPF